MKMDKKTIDNLIEFVVVVVCFNAGKKLKDTLDSIYSQEYWGYKVIIKDGGSTDASLDGLIGSGYFEGRRKAITNIFVEKDKGIYDAMNAAVSRIEKDEKKQYIIFMNCGDTFYSKQTLGEVADKIEDYIREEDSDRKRIFYGNQFNLQTSTVVSSNPQINEFALYRNVPCHQVCFYDKELFEVRAYNTEYKVRADYEHFLYCVYKENAETKYLDILISNYEGGGFSETKENRKKSSEEHRVITDYYMGKNAGKYRRIMLLSGAPIRTRLAESKNFSRIYNKIKSAIYR